MISFIDEHRSVLGVEPICRLLPIAPSTYYEVVAKRTDVGRLSARERNDIAMKVEIRRVFNEDADLLYAIIRNDDNLTYGNIVNVATSEDQTTSALTDDGIDELRQMLADARRSAEKWQEFLECFVDDEEIVARVKTYSPR